MNRFTLAQEATLSGIGLHTGKNSTITLKPSEQGYISFLRKDIQDAEPIKAHISSIKSTLRGTNMASKNASVHTVEHLLSACAALGITDLLVEMDGPEPPLTDGSSLVFAQHILKAGLKDLGLPAKVLNINKEIAYNEKNMSYIAKPADKLTFTFTYLRNHPLVNHQEYTFEMSKDGYIKEIAPSRTFGFEEELAFLKANGLALGGDPQNCVVIFKDKFSTPLRFPDEQVRHKILDLIGDLSLTGYVLGPMHITCSCGGHTGNTNFAKILLENI